MKKKESSRQGVKGSKRTLTQANAGSKLSRVSKMLIISTLIMVGLTLGLFAYENMYMPAQSESGQTTVFVLSKTVERGETLSESMFVPTPISNNSVQPSMALDPTEFIGKVAETELLAGDILTSARVSKDDVEDGSMFVRIEPDYGIQLEDGAYVRVYHKVGSEFELLFDRKRVYSVSHLRSLVNEGADTTGEPTEEFNLLLTEPELEAYYTAKDNGAIIISRLHPLASGSLDQSAGGE